MRNSLCLNEGGWFIQEEAEWALRSKRWTISEFLKYKRSLNEVQDELLSI